MAIDFGIKVISENDRILLDRNGIMQTWVDSVADNLDGGYPMYLRFYLPEETMSVQELSLSFKTEKFRSYTLETLLAGIYTFVEDTTHDHDLDSLSIASGDISYYEYDTETTDEHSDGHSWDTIWVSAGDFDSHVHPLQGTIGEGGQHNHGTESHDHGLDFGILIHNQEPGDIDLEIQKDSGNWNTVSFTDTDDIDLLSYLDQEDLEGWYTLKFSSDRLSRVTASYMVQALIGVDLLE